MNLVAKDLYPTEYGQFVSLRHGDIDQDYATGFRLCLADSVVA